MTWKWFSRLGAILGAALALCVVPSSWCGRKAGRWYAGDVELTRAHARAVARRLEKLGERSFDTGSRRFDGEWQFGTAVMAALGFGQAAIGHPELREWATGEMDVALDRALSPAARAFDAEAWGEDPLASLSAGRGHAAYLGYLNLALSLRETLGTSRHSKLGERISSSLEQRFAAAPSLVVETYPGERYPVDNAAGIASLALRAEAAGRPRPRIVDLWIAGARERLVDGASGLLFQAVDADARAVDAPRGSGTALAAYFLSFSGSDLSRDLHRAVRRQLADDVLGFGVVSEYPASWPGRGDIDSGPLVLGWSISAMGFSLGSCRAQRDRACFSELYRSFELWGAPRRTADTLSFVSGGPLGDAIVLAMLTALPAEHWGRS